MRYTLVLIPAPEGGYDTVECPALPGLVTEGRTREEAIAMAKEAIALYLRDVVADEDSVPIESEPPELATVDIAFERAASAATQPARAS